MRLLPRSLFALALCALGACSGSSTGPRRLSVDTHQVFFTTPAEAQAWPSAPVVQGGAAVTVRGTVFLGCGDLDAGAMELGGTVFISIGVKNTNRECVVALTMPYELTVSGVEAGWHHVQVKVAGIDSPADSIVQVTPGLID